MPGYKASEIHEALEDVPNDTFVIVNAHIEPQPNTKGAVPSNGQIVVTNISWPGYIDRNRKHEPLVIVAGPVA